MHQSCLRKILYHFNTQFTQSLHCSVSHQNCSTSLIGSVPINHTWGLCTCLLVTYFWYLATVCKYWMNWVCEFGSIHDFCTFNYIFLPFFMTVKCRQESRGERWLGHGLNLALQQLADSSHTCLEHTQSTLHHTHTLDDLTVLICDCGSVFVVLLSLRKTILILHT